MLAEIQLAGGAQRYHDVFSESDTRLIADESPIGHDSRKKTDGGRIAPGIMLAITGETQTDKGDPQLFLPLATVSVPLNFAIPRCPANTECRSAAGRAAGPLIELSGLDRRRSAADRHRLRLLCRVAGTLQLRDGPGAVLRYIAAPRAEANRGAVYRGWRSNTP